MLNLVEWINCKLINFISWYRLKASLSSLMCTCSRVTYLNFVTSLTVCYLHPKGAINLFRWSISFHLWYIRFLFYTIITFWYYLPTLVNSLICPSACCYSWFKGCRQKKHILYFKNLYFILKQLLADALAELIAHTFTSYIFFRLPLGCLFSYFLLLNLLVLCWRAKHAARAFSSLFVLLSSQIIAAGSTWALCPPPAGQRSSHRPLVRLPPASVLPCLLSCCHRGLPC